MPYRFEYLSQQEQICYPLAVIMLDRLLHTDDHPQCEDSSCPCVLPQDDPSIHTAPSYLNCSCQRCTYVRSVLAQAPTEQ